MKKKFLVFSIPTLFLLSGCMFFANNHAPSYDDYVNSSIDTTAQGLDLEGLTLAQKIPEYRVDSYDGLDGRTCPRPGGPLEDVSWCAYQDATAWFDSPLRETLDSGLTGDELCGAALLALNSAPIVHSKITKVYKSDEDCARAVSNFTDNSSMSFRDIFSSNPPGDVGLLVAYAPDENKPNTYWYAFANRGPAGGILYRNGNREEVRGYLDRLGLSVVSIDPAKGGTEEEYRVRRGWIPAAPNDSLSSSSPSSSPSP